MYEHIFNSIFMAPTFQYGAMVLYVWSACMVVCGFLDAVDWNVLVFILGWDNLADDSFQFRSDVFYTGRGQFI